MQTNSTEMSSTHHSNPPQRLFAASPKTPCHPSNGYAVNESDEDASPVNNNIVNTTGPSALAAKFDALAGGGSIISNDQQNEERRQIIIRPQPQDPEVTASVSAAEKKMSSSIMQEPALKIETRKRRGKSLDASTKVARRRSLRIQRRKSLCVEDEDGGASSQRELIGEECEIKVTNEAKSALSQAIEVVAMDLAESSRLDSLDGRREETPSCYEDKEEEEEGNTTRRRANLKAKSVLETLDPMQKENSVENNDRVVKASSRNKKRRDTFDLSRRRGLTRSGAVQSSSSNCVSSDMDMHVATDEADLKPQACNFNGADNTWTEANMITPRNGNDVQLPFNDEPETEIVGSQVVKDNLKHLASIDIEEKMQNLFSEFSVYNYVSFLPPRCQLYFCLSSFSDHAFFPPVYPPCLPTAMCLG